MASDNGGPWGGGGGHRGGNGGGGDDRGGGRRPNGGQDGPQIPEIDDLMRKGQEQLRVLMGGKPTRRGGGNGADGGGGGGGLGRGGIALIVLGVVVAWLFASLYRVDTSEQSVELLFEFVVTEIVV